MAEFDVAIVGLGAMGSAALFNLARRGLKVAGIERFQPAHDRGSSHGESRAIRLGYFEHPSYVPLVRAAYDRWAELERLTGATVLTRTGVLEMGKPGSVIVNGSLEASRLHDIPHEHLDAGEVRRRYPQFRSRMTMRRCGRRMAGSCAPSSATGFTSSSRATPEPKRSSAARWKRSSRGRDQCAS